MAESPFVFSKKHLKQYRQDEVTQDIAQDIKNGKKGTMKGVEGKCLIQATEASIRNPSMLLYSKQTGKKTRAQQLAETVEIPETLPTLPPYLQTFAFRYATETRRHCDWAQIFHCSIYGIRYWLLKPQVMQYILKIRQERQMLMAERVSEIEKKAYERLDDLLSLPANTENAETLRKTIQDALHLKVDQQPNLPAQITINANANAGAAASSESTALTKNQLSISELERRIAELDMIEAETQSREVDTE